jgi:hypothetical protein
MKRSLLLLAVALLAVSLTACAPGPNELAGTRDEEGTVAGFWQGLWHGFITPFTFIISLFSQKVHMYEVHNNGTWYNLGYLLGAATILGGGGGGAARRSKR